VSLQRKAFGVLLTVIVVCVVLGGYFGVTLLGGQPNNTSKNPDSQEDGNDQNPVDNQNPTIDNSVVAYAGTGQFAISFIKKGNEISSDIAAKLKCNVAREGDSIEFSLIIKPTSVSESLQGIFGNSGGSVIFNFKGTTLDGQLDANSKGSISGNNNNFTFDLNAQGTIEQNQLTFIISSAADSQINITTAQEIILHINQN
jgi:hypothetical protein